MNESLFQEVIYAEGILVLECAGPLQFRALGRPPTWAALLAHGAIEENDFVDVPRAFAFLEYFLRDAAPVWESGLGEALTSDPWTETLINGEEQAFSATARRVGDRSLLFVRSLGVDYEERCRVLRRARELALAHERSLKECSEKETLLHCLVHDVADPLGTVAQCFRLLEAESSLPESIRRLVTLGGSAAHRQLAKLEELRGLFAPDLDRLDSFAADAATAPELLECVHTVMRTVRYRFAIKGISYEFSFAPATGQSWKVVGNREQLVRVVYHLIDFTLADAPNGSLVSIQLEDEGPAIRVALSCHEREAGLDPHPAPRRPPLLSTDPATDRASQVGLLFCDLILQRWHGELGRPNPTQKIPGYWFRIPKPPGLAVSVANPDSNANPLGRPTSIPSKDPG